MAHRTTLILDDETRAAARPLARRHGCTVSEAIRRSVISQRDASLGVPPKLRAERGRTLRRLFVLFEGNDARAEVRRLKREDEGF